MCLWFCGSLGHPGEKDLHINSVQARRQEIGDRAAQYTGIEETMSWSQNSALAQSVYVVEARYSKSAIIVFTRIKQSIYFGKKK
jgi:hypothetical protein